MKRRLVRLIPNSFKPILKKVYYFPIEFFHRLKGTDNMIPPKSMIFVGDGDFEEIGEEFKNYFIELAGLRPTDRVLDVGCGIGRMAIPLTKYLSMEGEYWGFDIVKKGIEWCQNHISHKFTNFHFQHSDVYNKHYHPNGKIPAKNFRFPFDNESFDFVFLTSVFTHMLPLDMENYLSEISRVLRVGGKCLMSFYISNEESENLVRSGRDSMGFKHTIDDYLTTNKNSPEAAICYKEEFIINLCNRHELKIDQPIHYGSWCKRDSFLSWQDLIIATKTRRLTP